MTRLVVTDVVLLALGLVYAAWVSRISRGTLIHLFHGRPPAGRQRRVARVVGGAIPGGLTLGTARYGPATWLVNFLVFFLALLVVYAVIQAGHNRVVDRR